MSEYPLQQNTVFGIYSTPEMAEEAVDELVACGFASGSISVLFPTNERSREFAGRKKTRPPAGTDEGPKANLPLDGTWGFMDPGAGPRQGALPEALAAMGVPPEWCHHRVVKGDILVSVKCNARDEVIRAAGVLMLAEAEDISWSVPPSKYRQIANSDVSV
jgi:hypothetical protein